MSLRSYRLLLQARLLNVRRLRSTWKSPECEEEDKIIHWPELKDQCKMADLQLLHERLALPKKKRGPVSKAWYVDEVCAAMAICNVEEAAAVAKRRCSLPHSLTITPSLFWHVPIRVLSHVQNTFSTCRKRLLACANSRSVTCPEQVLDMSKTRSGMCQFAFCHMSITSSVICPECVLDMSKTSSGMCQFTF